MLHLQMRFRPVVPLKEAEAVVEEVGVAVVVARLLLPNPEQYRLGLALASHHTFGLAEVVLAPLIRHHLAVEADLGADLAA